jgi:transaldolase
MTGLEPEVTSVSDLKVRIFADGADQAAILRLYGDPLVRGFTTNPTLMRKAGVSDYEAFARSLIGHISDRPISLEVFSDDLDEMYRQALKLSSWGENVNVKIPTTNTCGRSTAVLIRALADEGIKVNVTAIMTIGQVETAVEALAKGPAGYVSVFAGRIADTGRDPIATMSAALELIAPFPNIELIWASPREVLNVVQASNIGCHIITVTPELLAKLNKIGQDLEEFSLETVHMFRRDAEAAGFSL